eukprot:COSAG06_NODE_2455_length_6849_cov_5.464148_14_plen_48_part_00
MFLIFVPSLSWQIIVYHGMTTQKRKLQLLPLISSTALRLLFAPPMSA